MASSTRKIFLSAQSTCAVSKYRCCCCAPARCSYSDIDHACDYKLSAASERLPSGLRDRVIPWRQLYVQALCGTQDELQRHLQVFATGLGFHLEPSQDLSQKNLVLQLSKFLPCRTEVKKKKKRRKR